MGLYFFSIELFFNLPDSDLTINGLIQGLKKGSFGIQEAILSVMMKVLKDRIFEEKIG